MSEAYIRLSDIALKERRRVAQTLIGDDYRIIAADSEEWKIGYHAGFTAGEAYAGRPQPVHPEPVDPSQVRIGDVVEIEADDGSWMVRGRVHAHGVNSAEGCLSIFPGPGWVEAHKHTHTVRVLRRAEPEPDPAAVEALAAKICEVRDNRNWGDDSDETLAVELIRRGVYVEEASDG